MKHEEKLQELTAAGEIQGDDYCTHRMSARVFTVHRPLKASELHMLTARLTAKDASVEDMRSAHLAASVATCTYPEQRGEVERLFERYGMAPVDIARKLMALAGSEEYTDPKVQAGSPVSLAT